MLASLFESRDRKAADAAELDRLKRRYGDSLVMELRSRAELSRQDARSHKHWRRLLRKVT